MTNEEREQIVQEVLKALGTVKTENRSRALVPTLDKWFRDEKGSTYGSKMAEALNGNTQGAYAIWELIRRATCLLCGCQYVRQIKDADRANEIADTICQTIYELAKNEGEEKNDN